MKKQTAYLARLNIAFCIVNFHRLHTLFRHQFEIEKPIQKTILNITLITSAEKNQFFIINRTKHLIKTAKIRVLIKSRPLHTYVHCINQIGSFIILFCDYFQFLLSYTFFNQRGMTPPVYAVFGHQIEKNGCPVSKCDMKKLRDYLTNILVWRRRGNKCVFYFILIDVRVLGKVSKNGHRKMTFIHFFYLIKRFDSLLSSEIMQIELYGFFVFCMGNVLYVFVYFIILYIQIDGYRSLLYNIKKITYIFSSSFKFFIFNKKVMLKQLY